jgi:hypothetical protein
MNRQLFETIIDSQGFTFKNIDFDEPSSSEEAAIGFHYIDNTLDRNEAIEALLSLGHSPRRANAILDKALEWSFS